MSIVGPRPFEINERKIENELKIKRRMIYQGLQVCPK